MKVDVDAYLKGLNGTLKQYQDRAPEAVIERNVTSDTKPKFDADGTSAFTVLELKSTAVTDLNIPPGVFQPMGGKSIHLAKVGSSSGVVVEISFASASGPFVPLAPGGRLKGSFTGFWTRFLGPSTPQKRARLIIGVSDEFVYDESNLELSGAGFESSAVAYDSTLWWVYAYNGASRQASYNVTNDIPSTATQGVSLDGVKAVRFSAWLQDGVSTFAGGDFRVWYYSEASDDWFENQQIIFTPTVGSGPKIVFTDMSVLLPIGRIWIEARSITTSGGSGAINIVIEAWRDNNK